MKKKRKSPLRPAVCAVVAALAASAAAVPASAQVEPLTERQLLAASRHVVVAVVEEAQSRWQPQGALLFTDYRLRVEDRLLGDSPEQLVISLPGGTDGDEVHWTSLSFPLELGERYLLFLGDLDRPSLMPITGGPQGAVREAPGFAAAVEEVRAATAGDLTGDEPGENLELPALRAAVAAGSERGGPVAAWEELVVRFPAVPPIVVNPVPASSAFSPHDRRQIAYWNTYVPGLFRIAAPPSPTWAFGNGVSDIAGFPDDAQMAAQFGKPWGPGVISFASSRAENGHTVEADLALNPAFAWTTDPDAATRPGGPRSFQRAILGFLTFAWGLGPSFGLDLSVDRESVTGLALPPYQLATLYAEDTQPALRTYPGRAIRDGLISSYSLQPAPLIPFYVPSRPSPAAVAPGGRFRLGTPVKIENAGSVPLANPVVEVYLVPRRFSFKKAVFLKRIRLQGTLAPGALQNVAPGEVAVPRTARPGTYYLAFRLADPRDGYPDNNLAWSNADVQLTVRKR